MTTLLIALGALLLAIVGGALFDPHRAARGGGDDDHDYLSEGWRGRSPDRPLANQQSPSEIPIRA
jgi:hypothetical protein